jgi:hypothetical protein
MKGVVDVTLFLFRNDGHFDDVDAASIDHYLIKTKRDSSFPSWLFLHESVMLRDSCVAVTD